MRKRLFVVVFDVVVVLFVVVVVFVMIVFGGIAIDIYCISLVDKLKLIFAPSHIYQNYPQTMFTHTQ